MGQLSATNFGQADVRLVLCFNFVPEDSDINCLIEDHIDLFQLMKDAKAPPDFWIRCPKPNWKSWFCQGIILRTSDSQSTIWKPPCEFHRGFFFVHFFWCKKGEVCNVLVRSNDVVAFPMSHFNVSPAFEPQWQHQKSEAPKSTLKKSASGTPNLELPQKSIHPKKPRNANQETQWIVQK